MRNFQKFSRAWQDANRGLRMQQKYFTREIRFNKSPLQRLQALKTSRIKYVLVLVINTIAVDSHIDVRVKKVWRPAIKTIL